MLNKYWLPGLFTAIMHLVCSWHWMRQMLLLLHWQLFRLECNLFFFSCQEFLQFWTIRKIILHNQRWFHPPGNIWQCPKTFLMVTTEEGSGGRHLLVEARDAASIPKWVSRLPQQRIIQLKCQQCQDWETLR